MKLARSSIMKSNDERKMEMNMMINGDEDDDDYECLLKV